MIRYCLAQPSISVVMPVLNEATLLEDCVRHIVYLSGVDHLVICDGGSTDGSQDIARGYAAHYAANTLNKALNIDFVQTYGGRYKQLNAAVALCTSDIVLCCAVDVRLQADVCTVVKSAVAAGAGHGCLRQRSTRREYVYRVQERWAQLRSRISGSAYMDQAPFWRRDAIGAAGGFHDKGTYDTAELSRRIGRTQNFVIVYAWALSSCRAWEYGFWRQTLRNQLKRTNYLISR